MGINQNALLEVRNLRKWYPLSKGVVKSLLQKRSAEFIKAVDDISFQIKRKEILGLAGESGSGKTTTGEVMIRLQNPTSGQIFFEGKDIAPLSGKRLKEFRKNMQMIFQDPYETLNPRFPVWDTISEPLKVYGIGDHKEKEKKTLEALERAGLVPAGRYLDKYPHELSGGERQRVGIARAIILNPKFVVADEPTSMLDVSIRAGVLNLLVSLRDSLDVSMLYISHDLSTIKYICDRTIIMYLGKILEIGPTIELTENPFHPYTKALISAVPEPDPDFKRKKIEIKGEISDPIDLPKGCRFHLRCNEMKGICQEKEPELLEKGKEHYVACHL